MGQSSTSNVAWKDHAYEVPLHRVADQSGAESTVSSCSMDVQEGREDLRQCRICLESDGADFISPCSCRGSAKYVHRECLDQWRATKVRKTGQLRLGTSFSLALAQDSYACAQEGAAFSQCTTCKARYRMTVHPPSIGAKAARFGFLVARDTLAISSLTQLCVGLYALAAYLMDLISGGALLQACGYHNQAQFYYHFGLFVFFFVAGVLGRQISKAQREHHTLVLLTLRRRPRRARSHATWVARAAQTTQAAAAALRGQMVLRGSQPLGQSASVESGLDISPGVSATRTSFSDGEGALVAVHSEGSQRGPSPAGETDLETGSATSPHVLPQLEAPAELALPAGEGSSAPLIGPEAGATTEAGQGAARGVRHSAISARDQRVLLRFRHAVELTPQAIAKGCLVAFLVGFAAMGLIEYGVATKRLDGYFVGCLALVSMPSGVFYMLRLLKIVWDSHRCVLTRRRMTEEYVVQSLELEGDEGGLPSEKEMELQRLGLW